ncbi:MAG: 23S rRNA (uracil(1939)-C(5))-methyltransferase RlmD [Candidatus Eremiobacteraeota bacterium]|nr:23S rRNA (uracil(1939)-C(5))-methyltransferase RlmD [Candidatus Eremiobacteraeota bacterium]
MTSSETAPKRTTALRAGAELELAFTDLLANGQGVGRSDGMVVFCFGPLPNERARVAIVQVKQRYAVAVLVELLSASPERRDPFCPVFGICGGCQLQHLSYDAQLRWKRNAVRDALQRIGGQDAVDVRDTIGMSEPRAYRNKMALVVDHNEAAPRLGFYRQRSHDVVPIDACPIVAPQLDAALQRINATRGAGPVRAMLRDARHLVVRAARATSQSALTITTDRPSESVSRAAPLLMREIPALVGVANSFERSSTNAIVGRRRRVLAGQAEIEEAIGGVRYRFSAESFFQVNVEMVASIFGVLEPFLERRGKILDIYCGVGTFALFFAKHGWNVHGIEANAQAIREAVANARRNGLEGLTHFEAGRVEELVGLATFERSLREADAIFLDPPRKGCDDRTLCAIAQARVPLLWYLSCDPATLARDSKLLTAKGYRLAAVQPFDMFPQTGHVETLVQLEYPNLATR